MRLYLDTMIWNRLADDQALLDDLRRRIRRSGDEVIGSIPLYEEFAGIARTNPSRLQHVAEIFRDLVGRRILHPIDVRAPLEAQRGGVLPVWRRYLAADTIREIHRATLDADLMRAIADDLDQRKDSNYLRDIAAREAVGDVIRDHGRKASTEMRLWKASGPVADWVADIARAQHGQQVPSPLPWHRYPSLWLTTEYFISHHHLSVGENRRLSPSDVYDSFHAGAGAYYDVIITEDARFIEHLEGFGERPFRVADLNSVATPGH